MRLVKLGYGTLSEARELPARDVLQALHYEKFLEDYDRSYLEINKE